MNTDTKAPDPCPKFQRNKEKTMPIPALRYLPVHLKVWQIGYSHMRPGAIYATANPGTTARLTLDQLATEAGISRRHLVCVLEDLEYIGIAERLLPDRSRYQDLDPEEQPTVTDEDIWLVFKKR